MSEQGQAPVPLRPVVAAALAAAAAGWVLGGVFSPGLARGVGLAAPVLGAALAGLGARSRLASPATVQWLALPLAGIAGWAALATSGAGSLDAAPRLVGEALRSGGISEPPVPFDPGWRFLLASLGVLLGAAAAGLAVSLARPRVGVAAGAAVVAAGALVQPGGAEVLSVAGALVLLGAALAVSMEGEVAAFETRRLARGGGVLAVAAVGLVALGQLGFLFPPASSDEVVPAKRPEPSPPEADRVLFRARVDRAVPLRLGALDGYDGEAFLTSPYDSGRLRPVKGRVPGALDRPAPRLTAEVVVEDLAGHVVPALAAPTSVRGASVAFDPRTQQLRTTSGRPRKGMRYVLEAPVPPTGEELAGAPAPSDAMRAFARAPAPPAAVADLLAGAPENAYARLQFVRTAFYGRVVAAGSGNPVEVTPARVADMLGGAEASPYEITAAEVLLARWAGVPARLGYGYFNPEAAGGLVEFRPRHGATWLEAWFEGYGWVPILGTPPRARSSFSRAPKNEDPLVRPSDRLALVLYVPVRLQTVQLAYEVARWWLVRVLPVAGGLVLVVASLPVAAKAVRRRRRRRWAASRGHGARLLAAYAELRDAGTDLGIGSPADTPLAFTAAVTADEEHTQLAWLVTRGLWGDLRRDLTEDDVRAGEELAASVARRLRRAQPLPNRVGALVSRASLRRPYTDELPNAALPRVPRLRLAATAAVVALAVATSPTAGARDERPVALPERLAPERVGDVELRREPGVESNYEKAGSSSTVRAGQVFSIRRGNAVEGSLQVAAFGGGLNASDAAVRKAVVRSIGSGQFRLTRIGDERIYSLDLPEQRFLLWFPPRGDYFELMVVRRSFEDAGRLFASLLEYQRTGSVEAADRTVAVPVPDPRRGVDQ